MNLGMPAGAAVREIGHSREGRSLLGIEAGTGPLRVSITAGAHSDEPAGPAAALKIARELAGSHLSQVTWRICPHVNPDGAARNAMWSEKDPSDALAYAKNAFREPPPDDVEFSYPMAGATSREPRPENVAVAEFLRGGGPYHLHFSLHGMGFAGGAWWLIVRDKVAETAPLREQLRGIFAAAGLPLHDVDRSGEKGFFRIEPGFATTPTGVAMREFFLAQGNAAMAGNFLNSSMEFVQSLGGSPLVIVSELPLFLITGDYFEFRRRLVDARAEGDEALRTLFAEFAVRPVPMDTQVDVLCRAVRETVDFLLHKPGAPAGA